MQIREAAKKILCIRNVYQKELGRGKATTIASFERWSVNSENIAKADCFEQLTESEQQQITDYLSNREAAEVDSDNRIAADMLIRNLGKAIRAAEVGVSVSEPKAIKLYQLMDEYTKLLKKQGFTKREMLAKGVDNNA